MCLGHISSPNLLGIMPLLFSYIWILPFCMGTLITIVETEQSTNFMWNKSNSMFIEDVGASLSVSVGSNLVIECPTNTTPAEYYIIYWVSEQGFRDCFLPANDSKLFLRCDRPNGKKMEFTQEIKSFTGVPGGKDFKIGENYYLTSLSTGTQNGIENELGGSCRYSSMKLNLTIKAQVPHTTAGPTNHTTPTTKVTPRPTPVTTPTTPRPTTRTTPRVTTRRTNPTHHTPKPHTTGIPPGITDIPVISVPDPGSSGNTGVIDISSSARTYQASTWYPLLIVCLSIVHILYHKRNFIHR